MPPFDLIDGKTVLVKERKALGLKDGEQPTALCLSGGGIRSAAFCLGVVFAPVGVALAVVPRSG